MILDTNEPGMVGVFHGFGQKTVRRHAGKAQPGFFQALAVGGVHFIAVAMALADMSVAVDFGDVAALGQRCILGAKPHGAAQVAT